MTKKDLVRIIREVVRKEVKSVIKEELNSAMTLLENKTKAPKSMSLNEAINQTQKQNEFAPYPEIGKDELRAKFSGMQGGAIPQTDINNRPIDTNRLDPALSKALTRNYSDLVKRF
jgi:hypothetical protein|tara:strand:- start:816 stop:1163 length:348 start_codon:yes stop_codon:yes gene_type:complete